MIFWLILRIIEISLKIVLGGGECRLRLFALVCHKDYFLSIHLFFYLQISFPRFHLLIIYLALMDFGVEHILQLWVPGTEVSYRQRRLVHRIQVVCRPLFHVVHELVLIIFLRHLTLVSFLLVWGKWVWHKVPIAFQLVGPESILYYGWRGGWDWWQRHVDRNVIDHLNTLLLSLGIKRVVLTVELTLLLESISLVRPVRS